MATERTPSAYRAVLAQQRAWAMGQGLDFDSAGYLNTVDVNLRQPLSEESRLAFSRGDGGELLDTSKKRAKMRALHSSSALAVNVFDFWTRRDARRLLDALDVGGMDRSISGMEFEARLPTGVGVIPPNLDVLISLADGHLIGIESKFTEWMKRKKAPAIQRRYFAENGSAWSSAGLARCHALALAINAGTINFHFLDAPQLLKHALGLAREAARRGGSFSLCYVYFDVPGSPSAEHLNEIKHFMSAVGTELGFHALSYQILLATLRHEVDESETAYHEYLRDRYLGSGVGPA